MTDLLTRPERSARMALIRSTDTKPEMIVRKAVFAAGFRFRLHYKPVAGAPDLLFPGLRVAVFVNGCFWHHHSCQHGRVPDRHSGFWKEKLERNAARDRRNNATLRRNGWEVITIWECKLATAGKREKTLSRLLRQLRLARARIAQTPGLMGNRTASSCDHVGTTSWIPRNH